MQVISYGDFSRQIQDKVIRERIPLDGVIELTYGCNLKCVHCYVPHNWRRKELAYKEICRILDEAADLGCLWITFTGGDPFIREDFPDIHSYAKKRGFITSILTNGTLITPEIADLLKENPPFSIEITLHGRTKDTFERVTGVSGSFERCMRGIALLLERKLPLKLKTTVMTLNKHELWDMKEYVESLGIDFRFDPIIHPRFDGSLEPCRFRISPEEIVELDMLDERRFTKWKKLCDRSWGPLRNEAFYKCGAGINSFNVDPCGILNICMIVRESGYDLLQGSFGEAWRGFSRGILKKKPETDYECAKCEHFLLCALCPGWARLETGDEEKKVDYLCRIAELRREAFGRRCIKDGEKNGQK